MIQWAVVLTMMSNTLLSGAKLALNTRICDELNEISGWVFVNDSTLIAHNDSGDEPALYVLNRDISLRKKVLLNGLTNVDFEDITTDGKGTLYIGDVGNNGNTRRDLVIYQLKTDDVLAGKPVTAQSIRFSYANQTAFPPPEKDRYFDCEAMTFDNDSLVLYTKCRAKPFDGKCNVYRIPAKPGTYTASPVATIVTGKRHWLLDAVTAAVQHNNQLYLLTYSRVLVYTVEPGNRYRLQRKIKLPVSQKEALALSPAGLLYIGDERRKFSGGKLRIIDPHPKKQQRK